MAVTEDRRAAKRIPVEMWVEEVRGGDRYFQRSGNVSLGGMYLDGTIPHPRGTVVVLRFTLPGDVEPVQIRGEIVGDPDERRLGMHVKFLTTDSNMSVIERLRAFLERSGPIPIA